MSALLNQRYQQVKSLARGSDSEVWEGFDTLRNLPVLIKVYRPEALQDWKRIQLIEREARILAQINHIEIPGFVDFFALGPEGHQTLYLVSLWVNGLTLDEKLAQGWKPSLDEVVGIASKTLELLVYIHAFNPPLVHRDIKPSNLMLNTWQRVYLVDFGGAQEALSSQGAGGSTLVGTVGYMAPEQIQGRAIPATDLYSLGATLLQLLSHQAPAEAGSEAQNQQVKSIQNILGKDLSRWLHGMLAANPEQRYASAEDALKDLDLLLDRDFAQRVFFYPQNHKAQIPEIIHSLTLTERSKEDQTLVAGSLLEGRYEIGELLGTGTHSRVYTGKIRHNGQKVMLKELCLERVSEWKNIELFEREMEVQQRLRHPRIPAYIDSFQIREEDTISWFLVTEAIAGETLEQRLERGWRPTDESVWHIADQLLEILNYLHRQEPPLVHRDLKPSNVLITANNDIWLIDFGAVQNRLWAQGGGGSTIIGTFGYMAPEQFSGQAWPQSDLYGLGATLIRLLSHRHPIEIPLEGTGLHFQPFVSCPDFYVAWLAALLHPLYTQRFGSAQDALALLRDAAQHGQVSQQWLAAQQKQAPTHSTSTRRKRILPSRIRLDQVTLFLKDSETLKAETDGKHVLIHISEDQALRQQLQAMDILRFFRRDPQNQEHTPIWRRQMKDQDGNNTGRTDILVTVIGGWMSFVFILLVILPMLVDEQVSEALSGLLLPVGAWIAVGVYQGMRKHKQETLQNAGLLLPLAHADFLPAYNNKGHHPKASLLTNACLSATALGLTLSHEPPGPCIYPQSFELPWADIEDISLKPWLPEYPHWGQLLQRRIYHLDLRTSSEHTHYPATLWGTGSSSKFHAPPPMLRFSLSERDAESLSQILTGLHQHYANTPTH